MPRTLSFTAVIVIALFLIAPSPVRGISCFSDFAIVRDVPAGHLAHSAREIAQQLEELGSPLDPAEATLLKRALALPGPDAIVAIQRLLDAHVLLAISLSAETELKVTTGPALPYLPVGRTAAFLIKVDNLPRFVSNLIIDSPNAIAPGLPPDPDRWMQVQIRPVNARLSGERVDYFILTVQGNERGPREAQFVCATGMRPPQSPGPLSYNRAAVLFSLLSQSEIVKSKLAHLLGHQHAFQVQRRGPPLGSIRAAACLDCHATAASTAVSASQQDREQSCILCHRELAQAEPDRCPICGMQNCKMGCVRSGQSATGETVVRMAGVPRSLFFGGVGAVLVLSFAWVEFLNRGAARASKRRRWNLLSLRLTAWWFRQRWSRAVLQWPVFALFFFLIYSGFEGDRKVNLTPVMTWTIWWAGLIFVVLFFGKAWCFVCPWDFAAALVQRIGRIWGSRQPLTLGLRWPRALRNIYFAIGLFILLTWFELGYQVTASPRATAVLASLLAALAILPALLFEKRAFCRYACMVGRISGLYAMFAPVEVRSANPEVCRQCRTRDCSRGNERAPGCPTSLFLPAVKENTYCLQCGYCARSCPAGNVAFNVRPFASDLLSFKRPRADESILAIILLALTSFHGLTMTPFWDGNGRSAIVPLLQSAFSLGPLGAFTAGMAAMLAIPIAVYCLFSVVTQRLANDPAVSWRKVFLFFAYSLLPVALFYHLAHNSMHFFMEAQFVLPLISDPLGRGWDLLGTAALRPGPILSAGAIWWLQVGLVLTGHIFGIVIAHRAARRLYGDPRRARRALLPMLGAMVLYSWFSLWILHLDMNMRTTLL